MDEQKLIEAFNMMWGKYPEQVRLIRKDFTIIAGNEAYLKFGGPVGSRCNTGDPAMHKGCRAAEALKAKEARSVVHDFPGVYTESLWVPVSGAEDYYIHFTNGGNAMFAKLAENQQK